uniref:Hypothetical capsid protein n=1 Tax=uncultured virus TaxID=340016 RepID=A0A1D8MJV2_9VIRU|nr:hypothetical capsid protein [uncultured virus]
MRLTARIRYGKRKRSRSRSSSRFRKRQRCYRRRTARRLPMYRNFMNLNSVKTVLRYAQSISLDPKAEQLGATGSNVWQFSANGLYDPDTTGTGHQPMYFDNYAQIFKRYKVDYSTITVTVVNSQTTVYNGTTVVPSYNYRLFILADGTPGITNEYPGDMGEIIEEGGRNIKWRFVTASVNGNLPKLKHGLAPHKLLNVSYKENDLVAQTNNNPDSACYYYVGITSADGNTDPPAVYLYVQIKYHVTFFDRITIQPQN